MIPIIYGVKQRLHLGMVLALLSAKNPVSYHSEHICLVAFVGLILMKILKNNDQQLRAFSSGFNKLTAVLHLEKCKVRLRIKTGMYNGE